MYPPLSSVTPFPFSVKTSHAQKQASIATPVTELILLEISWLEGLHWWGGGVYRNTGEATLCMKHIFQGTFGIQVM